MICAAELAYCECVKEKGHEERGDDEHACGGGCQGRWKGEPETPSLTIISLPLPPPPEVYEQYGVTTLEELLEIASEELRAPRTLRVSRKGIRYNTPSTEETP